MSIDSLLSAEEAKLIIANAEGQYKTLYWIAAETGMRAGELAGLRIDDIGLDDMTIRVNQSAWEGKLQEPKTKNAKRSIAVTPELTDHIRTFLSGWKPNSRNLLFTSPRGKKNDPAALVAHTLKISIPNRRVTFGYEPDEISPKTGAHVIPKGTKLEDIIVWLAEGADDPKRRKRS